MTHERPLADPASMFKTEKAKEAFVESETSKLECCETSIRGHSLALDNGVEHSELETHLC